MKRIFVLLMAVASVICVFGSCSGSGEVVRVFNWGDYIDESVNDDFEEATGIDVKYSTFIQNEDMYTSVTAADSYYDVIVPSDYMISKMASEGLLAELNYDNIPNFSLISDRFKGMEYDPENKYAVPYLWGTVGIVYNKTMVDEEITSWKSLFDEKYAGKIFMMDSVRDSIGMALIMGGHSVNSKNDEELAEAE
ncbi:MAG: spermidine/putrescine ABC transporter substrate-binding protein, partial [Clostridia bacterium]|nr:spermidine/putrescine ABC transporter substrate-binding protein [Clostridia bacterium]